MLGVCGYFSLEGGGEAGIENQMGATGINGEGPLQWLCRGHVGSAGREPGKPQHSWGGRKHDKESRVWEV